jgi:hypothetical protein
MKVFKAFLATVAVTGLVACGEQEGDPDILTQAAGLVINTNTQARAPRSSSVPDEELLNNPGKYLRINVRDIGAFDSLMTVGSNGARTTWIGASGISVTIEEGVVVATRGLPRDLMGADARQTVNAIQQGGGTSVRVHDFLTDQDQITQYRLECTIEIKGAEPVNRLGQSIPAIRFEELCRGEGLTLTNVYWMDANRSIIRSLQAVSPDAGYLQLDAF